MLLLLLRHAPAESRDPERWPDDRARPLTPAGREVQARVSRALGNWNLAPSKVLASPWVRAAETAEILVRELGLRFPAMPCEPLAAPPDFSRLEDDLGEPGSHAVVALVGHSPWIEALASMLLADAPKGIRMDFPTSGVMGIDLARLAPGAGELRFLARPEMT
ncbi:MAG TPA: histidine phosphatase family protein [Gemmatimonadales bacterium]